MILYNTQKLYKIPTIKNENFFSILNDFFLWCILPTFILLFYRTITWSIPQYVNYHQIHDLHWWQFIPLLPVDNIPKISWFNNNTLLTNFYGNFDIYMATAAIIIYCTTNKKYFRLWIFSTFILFTLHLIIYLLLPCYAYIIDRNFVYGETDIINYYHGNWNFAAFPSYHNTGMLISFFPIFLYFFKKNNSNIFNALYILIINTILIMFIFFLPRWNFNLFIPHIVYLEISINLILFISISIILSLFYLNIQSKNNQSYSLLFKNSKFTFKLTFLLYSLLLFTYWIIIYIGSVFSKRHYFVDGIASFTLAGIVYIIFNKLFFRNIGKNNIYDKFSYWVYDSKYIKYLIYLFIFICFCLYGTLSSYFCNSIGLHDRPWL